MQLSDKVSFAKEEDGPANPSVVCPFFTIAQDQTYLRRTEESRVIETTIREKKGRMMLMHDTRSKKEVIRTRT